MKEELSPTLCPTHFHFCRFVYTATGFYVARLHSSCVQTKSGQKMLNIFPKHLFNVMFFLLSCVVPIYKKQV
jgi:hypothetical protein